jgi:predicted aldo/keto reductase-like oxidoreductase
MDTEYQAGTKGLSYAASKDLAVVVMEPIAGGRLAMKPPKPILNMWGKAPIKRKQPEWALMWVWNHPEVSVALSGMSTMQQVKENLKTANHSGANTLSKEEVKLVGRVAQKYRTVGFIVCTGCRYCLPCPEGVNIPEIISLYNEFFTRDMNDEVKTKYWSHITPESQAKRCAKCGRCEELCPQKLPVKEIMKRAKMTFEQEP